MRKAFIFVTRILLLGMMVMGMLFTPQSSVFAAPILTVEPITWNVVGLDSNNVNDGPNNFPVGARVCNTGDTPATNVVADFIWDSTNANIELRSLSLDPIVLTVLNDGDCFDFYFEVVINRTPAAYETARQYHIEVTADGLGTISTPTPREIYVERLVSQNRNSVLDIQLNGVSIATGGTMNLVVGNAYTIKLVSDTATNGYEQIETFINFPNTIFQVLSVSTTYTADAGTDSDAAVQLYADGCGWNDLTRSCTGTGKYGGTVTVEYFVQIISGGGTSEPLNTLIYDFSGSSYHYNTDYDTSARIVNIIDPTACVQETMAAWTFTTNASPTTNNVAGTPAFSVSGTGITGPTVSGGALAFGGFNNSAIDLNKFAQLSIDTTGYYSISINYDASANNNNGPNSANFYFSSNGSAFTQDDVTETNTTSFASRSHNLTGVPAIDNNPLATFRWVPFNVSSGTRSYLLDNVLVVGCKLPATLNLTKSANPTTFSSDGETITYTYTLTNAGDVPLVAPYDIDDNLIPDGDIDCSLATSPLAPGASTTCTGTYSTTVGDVTAGSVTNVATADATTAIGDLITSNEASATIIILPDLSVDKTNDVNDSIIEGGSFNWTLTVSNTGGIATFNDSDTILLDNLPNGPSYGLVTVLPGGTAPGGAGTIDCSITTNVLSCVANGGPVTFANGASFDAEFSVTPASSGSLVNPTGGVCSVDPDGFVTEGNEENNSCTDTVTVIPADPSLSVLKSETSTGPYVVDDTIAYDIVVTNTGNVTLTGVTVVDNSASVGTCTPTQPSTLVPGESMTCLASHVVTQTDVDNGSYVNTATGDSNETPPSDSTVTVNFSQNPALSILKSETSTGPYVVDDTITYDIVVTNTGNVTLTNVTVVDPSATVGTCTPVQPSILAPGESMTCPASHVVTQTDVDNGSYANTATGDSNETPPADSTVTVNFVAAPSLSVLKSETSTGPYAVDDTITYDIVVTNTGNVTLTNVTVVDPSATVGTCTPAQPSTLAPGESMTCPASHVVTLADVNSGSYVNTATGDSDETPPSDSTVTVNFAQNPALSILKSETSTGPYVVDDTITYDIVVTNTGNVTLTNVTVVDPSATVGTCTPVQPSILAPGESMTCPASHVVTQADVNNGSYANTATGDSDETPPSDSTVTITLAQNPNISITKSSDATGTNAVGDTVTYTYDIENTGDVTLTNVTVTDAHVGLSVISCVPAQGSTLAPGETMICTATYIVTQADLDAGQIDNTGEVVGTPPTGPNVTDSDPLSEPVAQDPLLEVVKSETSSGPYYLGDTINYEIVVTNTGNVTLTNVTVEDNSANLGTCTPAQPSTLAPGDAMTCPASHEVTLADLENESYSNTATADSNETPPDESTVIVNFGVADLSLVKTVTNTTPNYGSNINFILTVTNEGPEAATGVEVADNLPSGFTFISASASKGTYSNASGIWQIGDLALDETVTLNMTVRVNNSGSYTNTAEIVASLILDPDSTPNNNNPSEDDQDSVTVTPPSPPPPPPPPPPLPQPTVGFLIPVTGFAPNVTTDLSNETFVAYDDTSITLDIPSLSVDIPIVGVPKQAGTWNVSWLGNQAGWLEGSAFPSWNGNSVLTSHVYLSNGKPGPFAKLHELQTGDQIYVHAFGQKYTFTVLTNATISPTDRSVMRHEERPYLTLVTCADYDPETGTYKNRFIVRAVLVKVSADR